MKGLFMGMVKLLFFLFILVGIGIIGFSGYHIVISALRIHHPDTISAIGKISGYYAKVSQVRERNRTVTRTWFPQAKFKYEGREYTDSGFLLFQYFKKGSDIDIAVLKKGHPLNKYNKSIALIDNFWVRYLFPIVLALIGCAFVFLPILVWPMLGEGSGISEMLNSGMEIGGFKIVPKYLLMLFFALWGFALLMVFQEHIFQLLPSGNRGEVSRIIVNGNFDAFKKIYSEIRPNQKLKYTEQTPLMEALYYNQIEMAEVLVTSEHLRIDEQDKVGRTNLYYAVKFGNDNIVKSLLDKKAALNCDFGDLLILAISMGKTEVARMLIEAGHPLDKVDKNYKKSAGDFAILAKNVPIARLILQKGGLFTAPKVFLDVLSKEGFEKVQNEGSSHHQFGKVKLQDWMFLIEKNDL